MQAINPCNLHCHCHKRSVEWRLAFDTAVNGMLIEPAVIKDQYTVAAHAVVLLTDGLHERRIASRAVN